jgi:hypothetical protein
VTIPSSLIAGESTCFLSEHGRGLHRPTASTARRYPPSACIHWTAVETSHTPTCTPPPPPKPADFFSLHSSARRRPRAKAELDTGGARRLLAVEAVAQTIAGLDLLCVCDKVRIRGRASSAAEDPLWPTEPLSRGQRKQPLSNSYKGLVCATASMESGSRGSQTLARCTSHHQHQHLCPARARCRWIRRASGSDGPRPAGGGSKR